MNIKQHNDSSQGNIIDQHLSRHEYYKQRFLIEAIKLFIVPNMYHTFIASLLKDLMGSKGWRMDTPSQSFHKQITEAVTLFFKAIHIV